MTPQELIDRARELDERATPGPWTFADGGYVEDATQDPICEPWSNRKDNGLFIAESRTLLPALAAALEASEKESAHKTAIIATLDEKASGLLADRDAARADLAKIAEMVRIWADGGDGLSSQMVMSNIALLLGVEVTR